VIVLRAAIGLAAVLTLFGPAQAGEMGRPAQSDPALEPIADVPGLPSVLLIGDSISIGYTIGVRSRLRGVANVHRPPENCEDTTKGLAKLDAWLGSEAWAVIHFNFGLHDLKYLDASRRYVPPDRGTQVTTLARYESNLRAIVARLRRTGARLIFATTTPVPAGSAGRVEGDEVRYNDVAVRVMKESGVAIDDLHAIVAARRELQQPENVHLTADGYRSLSEAVAASIAASLAQATR